MNPFAVNTVRSRLRSLFGPPVNNGRKALTEMRHSGQQLGFVQVMLPATDLDYETEVGDGLGSSVLAAPLNWVMRTFPEAPAIVEKWKGGEQWEALPDHNLLGLLRRPNPFYSGRALWMATVLDFCFGEAFWLKVRNGAGRVVQVWWAPRDTMAPKWPNDGGKTYISHYEYSPGGGRKSDIKADDVVHFRFGLDPRNTRRGLSPLGALWREVATDDQAANFSASILKNLGIVGVVIAPKEAGSVGNKEAVEEVKKYIQEHFTGDKRGQALALGAPTDVNLLQYNLSGFDTGPIRDVSEERVCSALGIPAAVVGFGTGLQQTKVGATMKELRQLAWTGGIIPMQEIIADEVDRSLITEFGAGDGDGGVRFGFDTSKVRALWEDANEKHDRIRKDVLASIITPMQAQQLLGYPIDPERDVYIQPVNVIQLPDGTVGGIQPQSPGGMDNDNAED